jgi:hypothetical protein
MPWLAPAVSPIGPAGEWQYFDIEFHRPIFNTAGECISAARVTIDFNGVRIHDNVELSGPTIGPIYRRAYIAHPDFLPLQFNIRNERALFRNIWLVPITDTTVSDNPVPAKSSVQCESNTNLNFEKIEKWEIITAGTRMIESDRRFGSKEMWRYGFNDPGCPPPMAVEPKPEAELKAASKPPKNAIVLFDGTNTSLWKSPVWDIENGNLVVTPKYKDFFTKEGFGSCHLHIEWMEPPRPDPNAKWASPGNSGVVLMSTYEIQILDNYKAEKLVHADALAGAVYGQYPPSVSPIRAPGKWQYFDIEFHRPIFNSFGECIYPARLTLDFNGVRVQDNVELSGPTMGRGYRREYLAHPDKLPLQLQNHNAKVYFRNIWLVPIAD